MKPYYQHAGITLYHGDCREVLPTLEAGSVDLVLTDPPYGIGYETTYVASWERSQIAGDSDSSLRDFCITHFAGLPMFVFGSWKVARPAATRAVLIWDKGPASGMGDLTFPWKNSFEEIYVIGDGFKGKRDEGVIRGHIQVTWESKGRRHPNQKPVSLMAYLLSKTEAVRICDPFMGCGTTLRAAKDAGLDAIGIEVEERYCEVAARRLEQEVFAFPKDAPLFNGGQP